VTRQHSGNAFVYSFDPPSDIVNFGLRLGQPPATVASERPGAELPVREARRLCLYDHLAALRELIADATGRPVAVDVADQALALVDIA
jgi:hypothetical protein